MGVSQAVCLSGWIPLPTTWRESHRCSTKVLRNIDVWTGSSAYRYVVPSWGGYVRAPHAWGIGILAVVVRDTYGAVGSVEPDSVRGSSGVGEEPCAAMPLVSFSP